MTCILIFMEPSSCFAYLKDDVVNALLWFPRHWLSKCRRDPRVEGGDVHRPGISWRHPRWGAYVLARVGNVKGKRLPLMSTVLLILGCQYVNDQR